MSTTKQKQAARKNLEKARGAERPTASRHEHPIARAEQRADHGASRTTCRTAPSRSRSSARSRSPTPSTCATPSRAFDQVEGVSNAERDRAWRRIRAAARKYDVEIQARGWRELFEGGKAKKRSEPVVTRRR